MSITEQSSMLSPVISSQPSFSQEEGFSSEKYALISLGATIIGVSILTISIPAAYLLFCIATWYAGSALTIKLHQAANGTTLERTTNKLYASVMEINSVITCALLFPLTLFKSYHDGQGHGNRPMLLVNGYLSFGSTWNYQRKILIEQGFGPIYTINVGSFNSIESYAEQILAKAEQIKQETGCSDLVLICHSKGGLVSTDFATRLAQRAGIHVTDLITVCSPHKGTPMAYLGLGEDARQMRPHSTFHSDLRRRITEQQDLLPQERTRFFHIGSDADIVVSAESALIGERAENQLLLQDLGHLGVLFSSRVGAQIGSWLSQSHVDTVQEEEFA